MLAFTYLVIISTILMVIDQKWNCVNIGGMTNYIPTIVSHQRGNLVKKYVMFDLIYDVSQF